ncbi:WD40 repeat domain-containing protein [Motilibacter deserti]|uniref:WD40 repeat protein n=1 Tax=Motilibacter deserti TaxID=2714956 RepID=A0ABX0GQK5_9ACTN|nr:hypothetical protein [Motilibacter deserti]NHC13121.1 hypothetical protein [Motilibacter deserti]
MGDGAAPGPPGEAAPWRLRLAALLALTAFLAWALSACLVGLDAERTRDDGGPLGLPDRLHNPGWLTPDNDEGPRGRAAVVMNGSQFPYVGLGDTNAAALVGPGGDRMTERQGRDEWHPGEDLLLSPDGTRTVSPAGRSGYAASVDVQDLRTGRHREVPMPGAAPADGEFVPSGWSVLAWMPDGDGLVLAGPAGGLGVLDLATGTFQRVADHAAGLVPGSAVAVRGDGRRIAYVVEGQLVVVDVADGWTALQATLPPGAQLGGKAAWSPDGESVAVSVPSGPPPARRWTFRLVDASTGALRPAAFPTVGDAVTLRAVGWRAGDRVVAIAYRPEDYATQPTDTDTGFAVVRRADLVEVTAGASSARTLLRPPWQTLAMDVAQQAAASGLTFTSPDPPPVHLGRATSAVVGLASAALLLAVLRRLVLLLARLLDGPAASPVTTPVVAISD